MRTKAAAGGGKKQIAVRQTGMDSASRMIRFLPLFITVVVAGLGFAGCFHVRVSMDPVEVHATVDVNVKVDQALNNFFGDLDAKSRTLDVTDAPADTPTTAPAQ